MYQKSEKKKNNHANHKTVTIRHINYSRNHKNKNLFMNRQKKSTLVEFFELAYHTSAIGNNATSVFKVIVFLL